jgi:hypothetical protein
VSATASSGASSHLNDVRQLRGQAETTIRNGLGGGDGGDEFRRAVRYFIVARDPDMLVTKDRLSVDTAALRPPPSVNVNC